MSQMSPAVEAISTGHDERETGLDWGGEFLQLGLENAFRRERLADTIRHGRWLLGASVLLNCLFLFSDWRFHGTAQIWLALPARTVAVLASLAGFLLIGRSATPRAARHILAGWVGLTAASVAVLVTSHSELALFVVLLLPLIFYLGVPLPFRWTICAGVATSILLLAGYEANIRTGDAMPGLTIAVATLNCCLILVIARANRLQRLEWLAARTARAFAEELSDSRETLRKMFAAAPVPMVVTNRPDGRILKVNDACAAMFGISPAMIGEASFQQFYANPEDRLRLMERLRIDGTAEDFEVLAVCADGSERTVIVKAATVDLSSGDAVIAGIIDISDRKAVEQNLEWLASTDPLTRLPNRLSFFSSARMEMMRAVRSGRPLALLMVDLDYFKSINDTFGHHAGDQALKAFGKLCLGVLRATDLVGRLGGEEFGILLPETDADQAFDIATRLRIALCEMRLPEPNDTLQVSASIGLTLVTRHDRDLDAALARADRALYAAKRNGRNQVQIDPDITLAARYGTDG